ncbi:hypothetical protein V8C86DRAFT_3090425 [Haematococcus lacustris]
MSRPPINQFDYLMARGEGNRGASFKYTWKPDWRLPPGVNQTKVFLQLAVVLGLAAIPVYVLPMTQPVEGEREEDFYVQIKRRKKEDRMKWINSDDMPYK